MPHHNECLDKAGRVRKRTDCLPRPIPAFSRPRTIGTYTTDGYVGTPAGIVPGRKGCGARPRMGVCAAKNSLLVRESLRLVVLGALPTGHVFPIAKFAPLDC